MNSGGRVGCLLAMVGLAVACGFGVRSNAFLWWTVQHHFPSLAKLALTLGANPNATAGWRSVLMESAYAAETSVVEALLARGAAVDAMDDTKRQALHHAARNAQTDGSVVRVLLEHGANPVAPQADGVTPLMLAVSALSGGTAMNAIAMIAYADDVNQRDSDGNNALWVATTEAPIQVQRALLRAGANPNLPNRRGGLPIEMAASNGLVDRVELLLAFGADPNLKVGSEPSAAEIVRGSAVNASQQASFQRIAQLFETAASRSKRQDANSRQ
jgi:ankyrin repeat protein